jgi:hypothetical protein
MMNAQECRKKAEECLRFAESNPSGRDQWQQLSHTWSIIAEQRANFDKGRTAPDESRRYAAIGVADSLRELLDLT